MTTLVILKVIKNDDDDDDSSNNNSATDGWSLETLREKQSTIVAAEDRAVSTNCFRRKKWKK